MKLNVISINAYHITIFNTNVASAQEYWEQTDI